MVDRAFLDDGGRVLRQENVDSPSVDVVESPMEVEETQKGVGEPYIMLLGRKKHGSSISENSIRDSSM